MMFFVIISCFGLLTNGMEVNTEPIVVPIANNLTSIVGKKSDWIQLFQYPPSEMVEVDFQIHTARTGLVGSILNMLGLFPPTFDVTLTNSNRSKILFEQNFHQSDPTLNTVVNSSEGILVLVRNLNSIFPLSIWLVGQLVSEADIYDLRSQFPQCAFPVYSQGTCGACYADVVAGAGSDLTCKHTLSPQPIVSCSGLGGCNGGSPYLAAQWAANHGLSETSVCPYTSNTCAPSQDVNKDGCVTCKFEGGTFFFKPLIIASSEEAMKQHIVATGGSIMVIFDAHANFQDFFRSHPFGLYRSVAGTPSLGNHAVRIVGFGIEGSDKYWVAINSWGPGWGDRGSFRFKRGENLCKIEQYPVGLKKVQFPEAGLPENGGEETITVGGWKQQDKDDPYWIEFQKKYNVQEKIEKISTQISHGFTVWLHTTNGNDLFIHLNPDGTVGHKDLVVIS